MIEMTVFETLSPPVQAELIRLYQSERDLKRQVADLERDAKAARIARGSDGS
jgi:cell division protein FtsB